MERSKLLAAAFLAGAFTMGATVGFGFDRSMANASTPPSSYESFATELALTPAQRAAVDSILDARHRTIDSLLAPVRPQMERARNSAQREIAARLSADQQARYTAYLERRRSEAERWRPQLPR
jgi:hypothetical protein